MANTGRRGFGSMDPAKRREIARLGGRAAHAGGNAHRWTSEEAREAGSKGGRRPRAQRNPRENRSE
ncbi:general stress protein YciG [Deinobacterium chartae]|uniref:General stress protein YciG n=1 Tax=Deinobacterium chartae TaxID=521158 RepID=A0A841I521_9DEIO|nr:KGG domain-containing protein [Deinobacterium chartae]MBB6099379.1 general stress protein YciG [Deinobacterium chartae]